MSIRLYKSYTPGTRNRALSTFSEITKSTPEKSLIRKNHRNKGRNNRGVITVKGRGGGHKRKYRMIDFHRKSTIAGKVATIEYDPNRTANIALLKYADGERRYIIAPKGVSAGDQLMSGGSVPIRSGNTLALRNIPVGSVIHCVELKPGKGAQMVRSAGGSCQLVAREGAYATLRMRTGEMRRVLSECRATLGEVGNSEHNLRSLGKAGANRWRGKRPTVRGVAMNPVEHPHGGGNHQHIGHASTVKWNASAGQKVGLIAARRTGRIRGGKKDIKGE